MGWLKIDDNYSDHLKISALAPMAELLDFRGLQFCARLETDGLIPDSMLAAIARGIPQPRKKAEQLVKVGRWHKAGHDCSRCPQLKSSGWVVHDYLDYNPSASALAAERERARERMRKARSRRSGEQSPLSQRSSDEHEGDVRQNFALPRPVPSRPPGGKSLPPPSMPHAGKRADDEDDSLREETQPPERRLGNGFPMSGKPLIALTLTWDDKRRANEGLPPALPAESLAGYARRALEVGAEQLPAGQASEGWLAAVLAEYAAQAGHVTLNERQRKRLQAMARSWPSDRVLDALEVAVERADSDLVAYAGECLREWERVRS